ncbi:transcriptional regulator MntR [Bacillus timonensis]|uniref:Manganese transport regulator n=1 Tax=Bacillus timonensis TaxID=1033734 RepID=A0A4S3PV58_9BACI|nr:transcriptional regulator MntR [Bacillus timonensis]THE13689.1 transcriptional regulator MntR [Bacillus timonensis]
MPTPSMEDYLEKIYLSIQQKGYARSVDIASSLNVLPSSVTKMMQKLDEEGFGIYEKYRGFVLTDKGTAIAKKLVEKHEMLEDFLKMIGVQDKNIYEEVEKLEHYISKETSLCLSTLIDFFEENPSVRKQYLQFRNKKM